MPGEHKKCGQQEQTPPRGAEGPARKPSVEVMSDRERRVEARSIHVPSLQGTSNFEHGSWRTEMRLPVLLGVPTAASDGP